MKKIIVLLGFIGVLGFTSCQKHELTATEVIMCEDKLNKELEMLEARLRQHVITEAVYENEVEAAQQRYKDCIIASENN